MDKKSFSDKYVKVISIDTYTKLVNVLSELTDKIEQDYRYWYWDWDTGMDQCVCTYCSGSIRSEKEEHADNCPIKRGQDLLRSLK